MRKCNKCGKKVLKADENVYDNLCCECHEKSEEEHSDAIANYIPVGI